MSWYVLLIDMIKKIYDCDDDYKDYEEKTRNKMFKYVLDNKKDFEVCQDCMNDLEDFWMCKMIVYLFDYNKTTIYDFIAKDGYDIIQEDVFELIKYIHENYKNLAEYNFDVNYIYEYGCYISKYDNDECDKDFYDDLYRDVSSYTGYNGLKFLIELGFKFDDKTFYCAVDSNDYNMFVLTIKTGCIIPSDAHEYINNSKNI